MTRTFIAIEGLDGAGKSTQIKLLTELYSAMEIPTKFVHFPRNEEGVFGKLISGFLRGDYGDVKQVHPQLVALLFAEDRKDFASTLQQWLDEGNVVLVDRYVLSNIAFQCAKTYGKDEKEALRKWIYHFEYEYNKIPKPDLSIYLDVPFSFTHSSLNEKREGDERTYLQGKDDIHEKDMDLQIAVREEYLELANDPDVVTSIKCYDTHGAMFSVETIHQQILACIDERINHTITK